MPMVCNAIAAGAVLICFCANTILCCQHSHDAMLQRQENLAWKWHVCVAGQLGQKVGKQTLKPLPIMVDDTLLTPRSEKELKVCRQLRLVESS